MPESRSSIGSPSHGSKSASVELNPVSYCHSVSEAGRLLPSASRWNSIELNFNLLPESSNYDHTPSKFSKFVEFNLVITDRKYFKRFIYISASLVFALFAIILLVQLIPHKHNHHGSSKNLTLAVSQALVFFDAQKSGILPKNNSVSFRGDSGLQDGNSSKTPVDLLGGFYDSGNNIKFTFPTAYTVTLLSWTVIEYHQKFADIGELDHVKDIIKWGSSYLLKVFVPPNSTTDPTTKLYSQVGSAGNSSQTDTDISCWQRPEDMTYPRPVSVCDEKASDLAGEIVAALSAASIVFKEEMAFSKELIKAAEKLFGLARKDPLQEGTYTMNEACGGDARQFYNSSGYLDEMVWGGTWLFFATGNTSYLGYATDNFVSVMNATENKEVFDWNTKLAANAVLLSRLRYFQDPGYPYEATLKLSSNMSDMLMCSYLFNEYFNRTPGGLILLTPDHGALLQVAATASFLSKLYSDYLDLLRTPGGICNTASFSLKMLQSFSKSQVDYILGTNPLKMSYLVGFGNHFPSQVHHRGASIPWDNQKHSCAEGNRWLHSKDPNPNVLIGAMVAGPDKEDKFSDKRDEPQFTEPSISGNAGLVAALIALHDPPRSSSRLNGTSGSIDKTGIFTNIRIVSSSSTAP